MHKMIPHRPRDNVLVFQKTKPSPSTSSEPTPTPEDRPKLHPGVRRRRITWLIIMFCFILWAVIQIFLQQLKIWEKQDQLAIKQSALKQAKKETAILQKGIEQLNDYHYLMELAHKYGYGKKGEKNYHPSAPTE